MEAHRPRTLLELNRVMLKACEKDAQRRYRSAAALHQDLLRLKTAGPSAKPKSWGRRWFTQLARRSQSTP